MPTFGLVLAVLKVVLLNLGLSKQSLIIGRPSLAGEEIITVTIIIASRSPQAMSNVTWSDQTILGSVLADKRITS